MRRYFELPFVLVRTLDRASVPVVRGKWVLCAEGESCFQIGFARFPVDRVAELDAIAGITCRKPDGLYEYRAFSFALDFNANSRRATFHDVDFCRPADEATRCALLVFEVHVPRRPPPRVVFQNRQPDWRGKHLAVELLIEERRNVAVPVQLDPVAAVFQRILRYLELLRLRRSFAGTNVED